MRVLTGLTLAITLGTTLFLNSPSFAAGDPTSCTNKCAGGVMGLGCNRTVKVRQCYNNCMGYDACPVSADELKSKKKK